MCVGGGLRTMMSTSGANDNCTTELGNILLDFIEAHSPFAPFITGIGIYGTFVTLVFLKGIVPNRVVRMQ